MTITELNNLFQRKENYIDSKLKSLDKSVVKLQSQLLELITSDYIGKFQTDDNGVILANEKNMRLAAELEGLMDKYNFLFQKSFLKGFGAEMLGVTKFTTDYFKGMGYSARKLASIEKGMGYISTRIGITDKGNIIKGSFLDSLSQNAEVRKELKDYVLNSVAGQKDYYGFLKGMKERIVGNPEAPGIMERYYRQYAYDSFNQVDRTINMHFADELGLKYFVYFGSLVRDSRAFCKKRAGKVFSVEETEEWVNDPILIGKTKEGYNPLIDLGRWNCRHSVQYIPAEVAFDKRPDLKNITGDYGINKAENVELAKGYFNAEGAETVIGSNPKASYAAIYNNSTGKIHINKSAKYWKDPNTIQAAQFKNGWWSTDNPMGVIYHETAHKKFAAIDNFFGTDREIAYKVSRYAGANPKEFVSEVYSGIRTGKKYSEEIMMKYKIYAKERES